MPMEYSTVILTRELIFTTLRLTAGAFAQNYCRDEQIGLPNYTLRVFGTTCLLTLLMVINSKVNNKPLRVLDPFINAEPVTGEEATNWLCVTINISLLATIQSKPNTMSPFSALTAALIGAFADLGGTACWSPHRLLRGRSHSALLPTTGQGLEALEARESIKYTSRLFPSTPINTCSQVTLYFLADIGSGLIFSIILRSLTQLTGSEILRHQLNPTVSEGSLLGGALLPFLATYFNTHPCQTEHNKNSILKFLLFYCSYTAIITLIDHTIEDIKGDNPLFKLDKAILTSVTGAFAIITLLYQTRLNHTRLQQPQERNSSPISTSLINNIHTPDADTGSLEQSVNALFTNSGSPNEETTTTEHSLFTTSETHRIDAPSSSAEHDNDAYNGLKTI